MAFRAFNLHKPFGLLPLARLLTPLISASGCGCGSGCSTRALSPFHYLANAAAPYQEAGVSLLPPLEVSTALAAMKLRFLARIKMAQHFTRHYALPASVCVTLCELVVSGVCVCVGCVRYPCSLAASTDGILSIPPLRRCRECCLFVWLTGAIQIDFVWR